MYELGGNPKYITAVAEVTTDGVSVGTVFDSAGKERISAMPYGYDVAEGNIANHVPFSKIGYNPDVDANEEDLWAAGGTYVFPTTQMKMRVVSSSTADDSTDTGARTIYLEYLTETFAQKTETITLDGTTPVETASTDIYRVNRFRVLTAGTGAKAAGNIDIASTNGTPIYSRIPTGLTAARNAIYTVPLGYNLHISQMTYSIGNASGGRFGRFSMRANYLEQTKTATGAIFYPYSEIGVQDGPFTISYDVPMKFPSGTDIRVVIQGDAANADAICSVQYRGWLEGST